MDILYDRSDTIRESYQDVQFTMVLTLGLVVMVIFLFLRNCLGDHHPQPGAAVLDHRNVRGDVPAELTAWTTSR